MLPVNFSGPVYRLANNWMRFVNVAEHSAKPIKYLEIGAFYGANLISVANSYASHPNSELHAVDPWEDYNEYPEYKGEQPSIHATFLSNIMKSGSQNKITVHRGYSNLEVPKFEDAYFDIIYIDGNHNPEYVLEDAVLCFRKLKPNGMLIFDDYGWGGPDLTQKGIDAFLSAYSKRISLIKIDPSSQVFIRKLR
jgi:SAM-dependent methyltransferase